MINEILPKLEKEDTDIGDIEYYHYGFTQLTADVACCLHHKTISYSHAKKIIDDCWYDYCGYNIIEYLCSSRLMNEASSTDILVVVRGVIAKNERAADQYRSGNTKAIGALVGSVLKIIKADPKIVQELIKVELTKELHE
jgi:Asp-tRNA(Asn)/Glu-tRNA(Gln) amidotransferase B subunit